MNINKISHNTAVQIAVSLVAIGTIINSIAIIRLKAEVSEQPASITEIFVRTEIEEVLTTIDLEELKDSIKELDEQLHEECLFVIHHHTGDPVEGLRHYVDRHYDGNACQAADEAARGEW